MASYSAFLNLHVICEGVENESQVDFLQKNNCDEIQGYYFSHPLSSRDLEQKFQDIQHSALHWSKIKQI
ncbi:EAL domain-containing protein [Bacillus sp. Marseille-P3661]|uniref:EAL domain-containing protein n=1 Tax=Bacillus sp. Marseille-P3661 TaxID=1936234 RepID=UPI000C84BC16|nr:EAL domain-containing protein [Bacillus sp. Marseille-P3661]